MSEPFSILLIEDDRFLRRACETSLQRRGFVVRSAVDGEEGLKLAREHRHDLVLLDLLMPKVTGIEVLTELRANPATADMLVVILSNSSREEDKRQAARLGANGYYVKANLSLQALGDEIDRVLTKHGVTRPAATRPDASVDTSQLRQLVEETGMPFDELVRLWVGETSGQLTAAATALDAGDLSEAARLTHSAAGATGVCGFRALAGQLSEVEQLTKAGRGPEAHESLVTAHAEFVRVSQALTQDRRP